MTVIIGVDPHKQSHTAVAICGEEREVAKVTVRATRQQTAKLLAWAEPFRGANLGHRVCRRSGLPVGPAARRCGRARRRCSADFGLEGPGARHWSFGEERPNDAFSVAVAALRSQGLRRVEVAEHSEIMRLLAKRNHDLGRMRARLICRLHNALADLSPGGIPRNSTCLTPIDCSRTSSRPPRSSMRYELALELVDDVRRLDKQIKESHRRIRTAVRASKTSLTELFGVGPIVACAVIGYTGDVRRFANRDHFAAYAGVADRAFVRRTDRPPALRAVVIASSTTPSTLRPSHRSASRTPMAGPTSIARSPRARPSVKRFARSSAKSPTPSTASWSSMPKRVREDTRKRLVACVVGSAS